MAISYPLSLPASPAPSRLVMRALNAVAMTQSPFTLQQQVQEHQGNLWLAEITLPPMVRATAEEWIAFLLKLRGRNGTFLLPPYGAKTPRGIATGTPRIKGASQTGFSLNTRTWTASQASILKTGDYFQVMRNYLKSPAAFDAADWVKAGAPSAPVVTPNVASPVDPDGTQTADQIDFPITGVGQSSYLEQPGAGMPTIVGQTFLAAIFLRATAAVSLDLQLRDQADAVIASANAALSSSAWAVFTVTGIPASGVTSVKFRLAQIASQAAKTVYAWGANLDTLEEARLHKALGDAASDGNGLASLDIWPRIRQADDFGRLIAQTPVGVFRLAENQSEWDISTALHYGIGLSALEAI